MNQSNILLSLVWSGSCRLRSPNGAGNARHAATNILASVMPSIEDHIAWTAPDIGRDESPVRCNARRGYAWIAVAEDAVYCAVVGSRGSAMLEIHFAAFRDIPSVTDEYAAYKRPENSQSDWFHMLRKAEKRGIYGDGRDFALYMRLLGMYHEKKKWDTADEETAKILADRVLQVAPEYGEGHEMYTVPFNALPTLLTFLRIKGMPAHGNATEQEFHNCYAKQRRVRRQIKNQKGALFLGALVSVVGTCRKRGIPFAAFLHLLCDGSWNLFDDSQFLMDPRTGDIDSSRHPNLELSGPIRTKPPPELLPDAAAAAA